MNSSPIFFDPVFPLWLISLLIIPLFSFLTWKEVKRNQKHLPFRIIAQFLVLISILGLFLRPGYVKEIDSSGVILLTPGYNESKVDSLLQVQPDLTVLRLPEAKSYQGSEVLTSFNMLADLDNEILFILGEGLPKSALELMAERRFQFFPIQNQIGVIQLHQPESSKVNQTSRIHGIVSTEGQTTLTLIGPGGREDSVVIRKKGVTPFSLTFKPKQPGLFVYSLLYKDNSQTHTDQLPVVVTKEEKLNVLFLQKFPSFEVRQLKNFLAEKGHRIALRFQVSKNNFRFEFANLPVSRMSSLNSTLLQSFDLVVIDNDGLEALSIIEKNALEESIRRGLGMIILLNKTTEKDKLRERFLPIDFKKISKDTTIVHFQSKQYTLPVLPLQITETSSMYPITKNGNRVLSGYVYAGLGKTGFQLLQETYRLALEGNVVDYATIWTTLLEKCSRYKHDPFKIHIKSEFPFYQDESLQVEIISSEDKDPALLDDQVSLALTEHVLVDNTWYGKTWAGKPGWHKLSADSSTLDYFVSEPSNWRSLRLANQVKQNERVAVSVTQISRPETTFQRKRITSLIFYLLFLLASGYLWLAPKI